MANLHTVCHRILVLRDHSFSQPCLFALYTDAFPTAMKTCNFRFYPDPLPHYIIHIYRSRYVVSSPRSTYQISCPTKQHVYPNITHMLVELPCGCSLRVQEFYVPNVVTHCIDTFTIDVKYPINLIQLFAFELQDLVRTADTPLYNDTLLLDVPHPVKPTNLTEWSDTDRVLGVHIKKLATALKNRPTDYQSLPFDNPFDRFAS